MNKSFTSKTTFNRSISVRPSKNLFEYDINGELSTMLVGGGGGSNSGETKTKVIRYRKAGAIAGTGGSSGHGGSGAGAGVTPRSASLHRLHPARSDLAEQLRIMAQQRMYLLPSMSATSFIVVADCGSGSGSGSKYEVEVGPQTCSCRTRPGPGPCVHLLFVMTRVLRVDEENPVLLADRLRTSEVDQLLTRFRKRQKEKLRHPCCRLPPPAAAAAPAPPRHMSPATLTATGSSGGQVRGAGSTETGRHRRQQAASMSKIDTEDEEDNQLDFLPGCGIDEIICSICLSEMSTTETLVSCASCNNEFHRRCISIWIKECRKQDESITCPLCRDRWRMYEHPLPLSASSKPSLLPRSPSASSPFPAAPPPAYHQHHSHRPLGYCFSQEIAGMLGSELSDKREAGLRLVAEKTVHIVLSAGTAHSSCSASSSSSCSHNQPATSSTNTTEDGGTCWTADDHDDVVGSMGGHTTGVVLKEAFRVIARLLDDVSYSLFVAALRAFREVLGYLVCRTEAEVERMSRMISPVVCQLLRICGDFSQKKKSQMCLSALFELAKGQEGGISLGREVKKSSLAVTGCHRLARFVLAGTSSTIPGSSSGESGHQQKFKPAHCYGRMALLERLLDKFDLPLELLQPTMELVANQLILMHRSLQLLGGLGDNLGVGPETTDVDTGLTSTDVRLLAGGRLHKLARVLFVSVARLTAAKLRFRGASADEAAREVMRHVGRVPDKWREKLVARLRLEPVPVPVPSVGGPALSGSSGGGGGKGYRMSKRFSSQHKLQPPGVLQAVGATGSSGGGLTARTRSVGNVALVLGGGSNTESGSLTPGPGSSGEGGLRACMSPFLRITPEPAYDAVPGSEDEDDDEKEREQHQDQERAFLCELATHNSMYGSMAASANQLQQQQPIWDESQSEAMSLCMLRAVVAETDADTDTELESRPPPGLGVFLGLSPDNAELVPLAEVTGEHQQQQQQRYRQGHEWLRGPLIGTGAFSKCYQARDARTGRLMAVKVQSCGSEDGAEAVVRAVRTEVQLMTRLRHANVLPLLGAVFCEAEATVSVFVRWMPGGSVAGVLHQYGPFGEAATLAYSLQAARGLAYIHSCRILHRDLKGANLLLDTSGMRLRISDFGASARLSNGRDSNASDFRGQLLGTIAFMAPEVLRGEQYGRSCDVWSFGCCIIEMLTSSQPWKDHNHTNHLALMYTIASAEEPPKLPEKISPELTQLLNDCFMKHPKQRPLSNSLELYKVYQNFLK